MDQQATVSSIRQPDQPSPTERPAKLPYPATEDNIPKLKEYLVNAFSTTTFNKDGLFPVMDTKPAHIHIQEDGKPNVCHNPIPVPFHWKAKVKASLDEDVHRGNIAKYKKPTIAYHLSSLLAPKKQRKPLWMPSMNTMLYHLMKVANHFHHRMGPLYVLTHASRVHPSGDSYTSRYDDIIKDVPCKVKYVDDALLYDTNIEESFFYT